MSPYLLRSKKKSIRYLIYKKELDLYTIFKSGFLIQLNSYFTKADAILAAEFKRQLESNCHFVLSKEDVKWFNKRDDEEEDEMDDTIISYNNDLSFYNSSIDILTSNAKYKVYDSTNREYAVKFSDWLPPTEITEEVFHAVPTYVDNKCVVYLHSKKYSTLP